MIWNKVYCYCSLLLTFKYATAYENKSAVAGSTCCCSTPTYVIGSQKVAWQTASVLCQQAGMDLASPSTEEEENALEEKWAASETLLNTQTSIWIGGKRCTPCYHIFHWEALGKPVVYSKYLPNQPDNSGNNENCLELEFIPNQGDTGLGWNDRSCDTELGYACQSRCCCSQNN